MGEQQEFTPQDKSGAKEPISPGTPQFELGLPETLEEFEARAQEAAEKAEQTPFERITEGIPHEVIENALQSLPNNLRRVLELREGLTFNPDGEPIEKQNRSAIASYLGVTPQRISAMERLALNKLRNALKE